MSKHYSIHNNVELRKGGRTIAKLSEKDFAEKAKKFILDTCKDDSWVTEKIKNTDSSKRIISYLPNAIRLIIWNDHKGNVTKATTTIGKDFKGIRPDWENYDITGGLRSVKGAPYIIMEVGGDWECPIAIFVYHDGKEFRCYIPKKGNAYRDDLKILFGNNDASYDPNTEVTSKYSNEKKKILSDDEYAFQELVKDGILDPEKDKDKKKGLGRDIWIDINKCIEDFSARVEIKSIKEQFDFDKSIYRRLNESHICRRNNYKGYK